MKENKIDLLVTFDKNYIGPFKTMLKSLQINNPGEVLCVWLLHSMIPQEELQSLQEYCNLRGVPFTPILVDRAMFENAPITDRYPQEMYYRLLAPLLLPDTLQKILYLDPDILVINPIRPLWDTDLGDKVFAGASHSGLIDVVNGINRVRLGTHHDYYNTGVMLIDLPKAREIVRSDEIFQCVRKRADALLLPDQDVFNLLYGSYTLPMDDAIWNYDARNFSDYLVRSTGTYTVDWVLQHTVVLHFCGRNKPWKPSSNQRFATLYKHYMQLEKRT